MNFMELESMAMTHTEYSVLMNGKRYTADCLPNVFDSAYLMFFLNLTRSYRLNHSFSEQSI